MEEPPTHDELEEHFQESLEWPEYYHHRHPDTDLPEVYYRLDGPNGPAWYMNPGGSPRPSTMRSVMLEAAAGEFHRVFLEDTPFTDVSIPETN